MTQRRWVVLAAFAGTAALNAAAAWADDRAEIDRTNIIGNRELPKVLYIVPWKKPGPGDMSGPPSESVLDEALAPVDRDVFRRQVRYNAMMQPAAGAQPPERSDAAVAAPAK